MDNLISASYYTKELMLFSSVLAPILFFAMRKYALGVISLTAVIFTLIILSLTQDAISLMSGETQIFLYATQLLNICAAATFLFKVYKKDERLFVEESNVEYLEDEIEIEEDVEEEVEEEVKNLSDLIKEKKIEAGIYEEKRA